MQFEVTMRDGSAHRVEAAYLEVVHGPTSSSYTLLGPLPGLPSAILAAFPADLVQAVTPIVQPRQPPLRRRATSRIEHGPMADERVPSEAGSPVEQIV